MISSAAVRNPDVAAAALFEVPSAADLFEIAIVEAAAKKRLLFHPWREDLAIPSISTT